MNTSKQKKELTAKQLAFCKEYIVDYNQRKAGQRAGFTGSSQSVDRCATRIMKDERVRAKIRELEEERDKQRQVRADEILANLWKIASFNLLKVMQWNDYQTFIKPSSELDAETAYAIEEISESYDKDGNLQHRRIKVCDKLKALEQLGKASGLFRENNVQIVSFEKYLIEDERMRQANNTGGTADEYEA